ncbi:hypothetical protein [Burkholderia pseudomultivorans]|uniref:hypothetical protein n=1 Tax=Burkholderia pseudomultivorans TaxID=1207504 RepID=UPI000B110F54|nr:hypothetical protein [Burkholderia pseudomultivorans]MBF5009051.1 hypothetical protein [Burkholderia pseudomultivorans]
MLDIESRRPDKRVATLSFGLVAIAGCAAFFRASRSIYRAAGSGHRNADFWI